MTNLVLGILAHVDAGKTTLSESILYNTGAIRSLGRVDKRDAFLDTDAMEKERGITIFSKQAMFELKDDLEGNGGLANDEACGYRVTLLDTPGHVDFSPEAERTLWVLDVAILVVSGADGVQGHTRTLFELLEKYNIPTFIFVNKMDQPGTDSEQLLTNIKSELSGNCISFMDETDDEFLEEVSLCDENMMEYFLENGEVKTEDIRASVHLRKVFPVYFGSALKNEGVERLLEGIRRYSKPCLNKANEKKDNPALFSARVYKITRDDQGNRLTHFKVTNGQICVREVFSNDEKITQLRVYNGAKYETVNEAKAGGIYCALGLMSTYGGQGIGNESDAPAAVLEPVMTYKVNLPIPGTTKFDKITDPVKMMTALNELCEDLPELHVNWDEELKEIHVSIMGDVQLEILKQIIQDRYDTAVTFGAGRTVYKETIANVVEGVGHFEPLRHYAEVHLKLEPGERGSGITVESVASTDELALNWQRLIQTHVLERSHRGVLTGSVATDIKITLLAGRAHPKHTMGGDFRQATYRAIRQGLMQAQNVLLEPYYDFLLFVPDEYVGRAMTDLDRRSAKFEGPFMKGDGTSSFKGYAPVSVMQDYPSEVTAYSGGLGTVTCTFRGYDLCHNSEEVIEARGYDPEADLRNTPDSVFCSHGAGVVVPWMEVPNQMHIEPQLKFDEDGNLIGRVVVDEQEQLEAAAIRARSRFEESKSGGEIFMGYEEVDAIVNTLGGSNIKTSKRETGVNSSSGRRTDGKMPGAVSRANRAEREKSASGSRVYKGEKPKDKYMLVDGYNVIHAWRELADIAGANLDGARGRLLDILCNYQAIKGINLIAVFDAYKVKGKVREIEEYHNIHVVYTKEAETADAYIEKFTHENSSRYDITVVTSDGVEQVIIMGAGCKLVSSREFEAEVKNAEGSISEYISGSE